MAWKTIGINNKKKYIDGKINFKGVDYSTQRFKVSSDRAIAVQDFIYKDGVVQTRDGIEQLFELTPTKYYVGNEYKTNGTNFNGLWHFVAEDGNEHIIAHIGKLLYEITNIENENLIIKPIVINETTKIYGGDVYISAYEFEDYQSSAFIGANRFYFLGGNKYMCLRYLKDSNGDTKIYLYPIEQDDETYIPTTSSGISYLNSNLTEGRDTVDKVNLLTKWRKNECITGTGKVEDKNTQIKHYQYLLDAPLIWQDEDKDMADFYIILEEFGEIEE